MESVASGLGVASDRAIDRSSAEAEPGVLESALMVDTSKVRSHLDEVVRSTVEETLNGLLDQEADRIAGAGRYERSAERVDTRAGSYQRRLETKAGRVTLRVPRLRSMPFETQIIERHKRSRGCG